MSARNKLNHPSCWDRWKKAGAIGMVPRAFPLSVVLSVVTQRHLSPELDDEYELVSFLTGDHGVAISPGIRGTYELARDEMSRQYPTLWDGNMQFALGELVLFLERTPAADKQFLILGWLSKQEGRLGAKEFIFQYSNKPPRP